MSSYAFKSRVGNLIEGFIQQKQAVGYSYQSSARILYHLDGFIAEKFPDAAMLTKEICTAWIHLKPGEHPNGF